LSDPNETNADNLPTAQLQAISAQCSSVIHELCDILSNDPRLSQEICKLLTEDDILAGIDRLRESDPELAKRLVTATFGIAVNTLHMVGIQQVLNKRASESN